MGLQKRTPTHPPASTGRGLRWVLLLAVLALGAGLALLWVASGREKGDAAEGRTGAGQARRKARGRAGSTAAGSRAGAGARRVGLDPQRAPGRVDRGRLARLLGRGMGAADPAGGGEWGSTRGGPGAGGAPAEEDPVWPLTAKGIKGAIQARIEEIKECYRGWLAMDDELGGKLVLAFRIERDPEGEHARVTSAEIQGSTLDHPGLERCVLVMAESLSFEVPPEDGITVRYPFRFKPAAD